MLKEIKYFGLSIIFSLFIWFIYPFLQVLPQGLNNFWFWFTVLSFFDWLLYFIYGALFGITLAFFIWQRRKMVYPLKRMQKGGIFGILAGFLGTAAPMCIACMPWVTIFLPFSFVLPLLKYNVEVLGLSIILLFLTLWALGGFQKIKTVSNSV